MPKIAYYIIGGVVLYLLIVGIKYGCSGASRERPPIHPDEGRTAIE